MEKEYKYRTSFKVVLLAGLIISLFGVIEIGKDYGFLLAFIGITCVLYFALLAIRYKIVITDEYIVVDIGKWGKRIERNWDKIYRVSRIPLSFRWMYRIHCEDKPMLMFSNSIANYKDLLKEIIKRSPNAIVDDSVRKVLENGQD